MIGVTIGSGIGVLAVLAGLQVAAAPAQAADLAVHVGQLGVIGNAVHIQGATVCILSVRAASSEFELYGHNISLVRPITTNQNGHGVFDLGFIHVHSAPEYRRFEGTITLRAHKDGFCAQDATLEYGGLYIHQGFSLRPIPAGSSELNWCGPMNGLRCDFDPQDRIRPQQPTAESLPGDVMPGDAMPGQAGQPQLPSPTGPRIQQPGQPGTSPLR
ncbi:MAG: hypothetical protein ACFCVH_19570 [Alphaproteobacteria bacterium]